jgi:hypothetical protein
MDQNNGSEDFDPVELEGSTGTVAKRIAFGSVLAAMLIVAGGVGYGLGRGTWAVPSSIVAKMPAPFSGWLPLSGRTGATAGSPSELTHYAFELVRNQMRQGEALLDVRLIDKRSGRPVPDAVIIARRLDMAPEGMATMTAKLEPQLTAEPGTYRFKTDLTMEGGWQLSLAAKVQGEIGTVQNKLVLKAVP